MRRVYCSDYRCGWRSRFRMSVVSLAVTSASHLIFAVGGDFSWPSIWGVKPGSPDG